MGKIGWTELLVILIIVLILFGGKRLPEIGSGLGQAIRNFRSSFRGSETKEEPSGNSSEQNTKGGQ
ncbi:MAG: twin-arginine translocase TatA/TatE family subunit [Thermodesulforhabdaceae bacterium]|jgi:sec-independent protein translocase protein TatA